MSVTVRNIRGPQSRVIYPDGILTRALRHDIAREVRSGHEFARGDLDSQYLSDFANGAYFKGLERMLRLHITADGLTAAFSMPTRLALLIAEHRWLGGMPFAEASHMETTAVAAVDPIQHKAVTTGCRESRQQLMELLPAQIRASHLLLHACANDLKQESTR
jgi:hypothetical protein